jgi:hypothetical protein
MASKFLPMLLNGIKLMPKNHNPQFVSPTPVERGNPFVREILRTGLEI